MPSEHNPAECLIQILEDIERINRYTKGLDRAGFAGDDRSRDAVECCLERICEAAIRLGEHGPELMPDQPWADIRGMGNRLRHGYDRLSLAVIWGTIHDDLPALAADARLALSRLLGGSPDPEH